MELSQTGRGHFFFDQWLDDFSRVPEFFECQPHSVNCRSVRWIDHFTQPDNFAIALISDPDNGLVVYLVLSGTFCLRDDEAELCAFPQELLHFPRGSSFLFSQALLKSFELGEAPRHLGDRQTLNLHVPEWA